MVSSVSPLRWLIIVRYPLWWASATASRVSVSVPIWFTLTSSALADALVDALLEPLGVGDEQVVADDLHPVADRRGQRRPALPIVFGQRVFDRHQRVGVEQLGVELRHLLGGTGLRPRSV